MGLDWGGGKMALKTASAWQKRFRKVPDPLQLLSGVTAVQFQAFVVSELRTNRFTDWLPSMGDSLGGQALPESQWLELGSHLVSCMAACAKE